VCVFVVDIIISLSLSLMKFECIEWRKKHSFFVTEKCKFHLASQFKPHGYALSSNVACPRNYVGHLDLWSVFTTNMKPCANRFS